MIFSRKYGVTLVDATAIYLPMVKRSAVDFAVGADWTPAAGDVTVSKDGAAAANITNLPTALTMGNAAVWKFILTATELAAKVVAVTIADAATKAVEDQAFLVETFGSSSALYPSDVGADNTDAEARFYASLNGIVTGVVGSGSTLTSIVTASLDPATTVADQLKGRVVVFPKSTTTSALRGQATDITANTSGGILTVSALTTAPVAGDVFYII